MINVSETGEIFLGDQAVTEARLAEELAAAKRRYEGQAVVIRGDRELAYQTVMTLLSLCQRAGIENIQLANKIQGQ